MADPDDTWPEGSHPQGSGATWGSSPGPIAPPSGDDARYERVGLLGKGGMGRVWLATDRRLDRSVALKEALHLGGSADLLAREARLTATLDHPGIVAVHDAGYTGVGVPFYTMPVVRGQSLDQLLRASPDPARRLALVRPFLLACQAVAYAHAQGVVHRDLKPANVLIGAYGETRVVDWGIACRLDEVSGATSPGAVVGTPAYMSPEQARGEPADRRTDVWGLGAVLYEILSGRPPVAGATSEERLRAAGKGEVEPVERVVADAPRELVAIVTRALAVSPADRYPDAAALAADVEAWVDGRPVAAHTYTPREILARFVRAYRLPLLVAAAAMVVVATLQLWSTTRLRAQRDLAQAAEAETRDALGRADASLARALLEQARTAAGDGALVRAEVLAAASLARVDTPGARGVLAATARGARVERLDPVPLPTCRRVAVIGERSVLCATADTLSRLDDGVVAWSRPAVDAGVYVEGRSAWLIEGIDAHRLDLHSGDSVGPPLRARPGVLGAEVFVSPTDADPVRRLGQCGAARAAGAAASFGDGELGLLCKDGRVASVLPDGARRFVGRLDGMDLTGIHHTGVVVPPPRPGGDPGEPQLLVAWVKGELARISLRDGTSVTWSPGRANGLRAIRASVDGDRVIELPERGDVVVRRLSDLVELARVPALEPRDAWMEGPELAVAEADRLTRWRIPTEPHLHRIGGTEGISALAVSPDARWVATGGSKRTVTIRSLPDGLVRHVIDARGSTVKHLIALPDGRFAWATTGPPPQDDATVMVADPVTGEAGPALPQSTYARWGRGMPEVGPTGATLRRLGVLPDGAWILLPYAFAVLVAEPDGTPRTVTGCEVGSWVDIYPSEGGAWLLDDGGAVARFDGHQCTVAPFRGGGAITTLGDGAVVGADEGIVAFDAAGQVRWRADHPSPGPTDLATSADGRFVAAAGRDRATRVYAADDGRLLGQLEGPSERVSAVTFHGDTLYTASWDGSVRLWDLPTLLAPVDELVARTRASWGLTVDDLLAR